MALSDAMKAVLKGLGLSDAEIAAYDTTAAGTTATKPTTNIYPSISSPTDATALINKVFQSNLQRDATAAELKYWKPLLKAAQKAGGAVQNYKVAGKTGTQTTNTALNEEVWLSEQLATNTDYKKKLPSINYAAELNAVKTTDPALFARKQEKALYDDAIKGAKGDKAKIATIDATTAYGRGLTEIKAAIESARLVAGAQLTPEEIATVAQEAYDKGLDREKNTLNSFIDSKFKFTGTEKTGEASKGLAALTKIASANGLDLQKAFGTQLPGWLDALNKGESIDTFANTIRTVAKIGMPENIKKLIDNGVNLDAIYSPYKNIMANTLEINPESISMSDPVLRSAIGGETELPLYQFERQLRKDNRWQYTNQAKGEVADATKKILQDFGFMG